MRTMGRRLWWHWIAVVGSLAGTVNECHAIVKPVYVNVYTPVTFESTFEEANNDMMKQVPDLMNIALNDLKPRGTLEPECKVKLEKNVPELEEEWEVVMKSSDPELLVAPNGGTLKCERKEEINVPGLRGWQVLSKSMDEQRIKTIYGRSLRENTLGISLFLSLNAEIEMGEAVFNIVNVLKCHIVARMKQNNTIWGLSAFRSGVGFAVYVTHQNSIPMDTLDLGDSQLTVSVNPTDPDLSSDIRIQVPGKQLKTVPFNDVKKRRRLPYLMEKLLWELRLVRSHLLGEEWSISYLLGKMSSIERKLVFRYDDPKNLRIDVMGHIQNIFHFVAKVMSNAAIEYVTKDDRVPFELTFRSFRMTVNDTDWRAS